MPSRQDQLHSYQYAQQRVVAALITHDPDPQRSPLRRAGTTALVSLLLASLAVGAVVLYGLVTGQSTVDPRDPDVVFQERGTGARYVYLKSDGRLHPVLNYTSGLLLAGGRQAPELRSISAERLAAVPLGDPVGIPDAPDSLPRPDALLAERWSVCTDNLRDDGVPRSTLLVGDRLTDGTVAARTGVALLVRDPEERTYLVHGNRRFAIPPSRLIATLRVLQWADRQPWPVSVAWINAIPLGPDLVAPAVPETGGGSVTGLPVGQLVTDPRGQFAVILADGVAALTDVQGRLMQAGPAAPQPLDIGNAFFGLPESRTRLSDSADPDGLPATVPALAASRPGRVCVTLPIDDRAGDGIRIDPTVPAGVPVSGSAAAPGGNLADFVHVARGRGAVAVVAASPSAPASSGTVTVVTDAGRQYPLADRELLAKLGYAGVRPRQIPAELISLMPQGPPLDPVRARQAPPQE